jgi:hypothetical protein
MTLISTDSDFALMPALFLITGGTGTVLYRV